MKFQISQTHYAICLFILTISFFSCSVIQKSIFPGNYCKDPDCEKPREIGEYCAFHYNERAEKSIKDAGKLKIEKQKPVRDNKVQVIQRRLENR